EAEFGRGPDLLYKTIAIEPFAAALRAWRGSVLILQRLPLAGGMERFAKSFERQAHDLSSLNDNLEDMAAGASGLGDYLGGRQTNMHIRAGLGKTARVLVPFPPEFRWMNAGSRSPWFPEFEIYRQRASRDWQPALERVRLDISI